MADGQPERPPHTRPIVAVVAPSCPVDRDLAARVDAMAGDRLRLRWAEQCFAEGGHFAGSDGAREEALVAAWNDPQVAAVWCARGGAGAQRIAAAAVARFDRSVAKPLLGYSDAGFLHAALQVAGIGGATWGPMPGDLRRDGGEAAVARALRALAGEARAEDWADSVPPLPAREGIEGWVSGGGTRRPGFAHAGEPRLARARTQPQPLPCREGSQQAVAYNLTVLCATLGTALQPPLEGRVLMLEDVGEPLYRIDRMLGQLTGQPWFGQIAGVRLGRFSGWENDREFGTSLEAIVGEWLARAAVPLLGAAGIGHDGGNGVVVF